MLKSQKNRSARFEEEKNLEKYLERWIFNGLLYFFKQRNLGLRTETKNERRVCTNI